MDQATATITATRAAAARPNPFDSPEARANSSYAGVVRGELVRLPDGGPVSNDLRFLDATFRAFVLHPDFPCLGGKAALGGGECRVGSYGALGSRASTLGLARDLFTFVDEQSRMTTGFSTFVAGFAELEHADERTFEARLWTTLQQLVDLDATSAWDGGTVADPSDPSFSFSFGGRAYFAVGMHPGASRFARRFPVPLIAFNAKAQFDALKADGRYPKLQSKIRERDVRLQGSINPNLAAFGESSEARQYSGRAVERDWACPFAAQK